MISLVELVVLVFTFNLMTFGNGPVMIPLLQDSLVDNRGVLTGAQLLYAFAIARVTPGQANVYVASVGYFLFGLPGAALSTLAILVPGYLMMPLMAGYQRFRGAPVVKAFLRGLTAASVGLIFAAVLRLAEGTILAPLPLAVFTVALALMLLLRRLDPMWSLLLASAAGVLARIVLQH